MLTRFVSDNGIINVNCDNAVEVLEAIARYQGRADIEWERMQHDEVYASFVRERAWFWVCKSMTYCYLTLHEELTLEAIQRNGIGPRMMWAYVQHDLAHFQGDVHRKKTNDDLEREIVETLRQVDEALEP